MILNCPTAPESAFKPGLPLHHRDPFDRILISQAINHSLTFISRDTEFGPYPIQQVWN
jgi:PIN domain nuclease of toxin-antitoxin system